MPENRNMGRGAHRSKDAEAKQNLGQLQEDILGQPTLPTVHPINSTKSAGEAPQRRHSRRGH